MSVSGDSALFDNFSHPTDSNSGCLDSFTRLFLLRQPPLLSSVFSDSICIKPFICHIWEPTPDSQFRNSLLHSAVRPFSLMPSHIINSLLQRESNYGGSCTVGDGECPCNLFKPEAALPRAKAADNHCVDNSEARIHRRLRKIFYAKPRSYFLKKRAFPGLFFFIFVFAGLQLTDNYIQIQIYHCRCWDSNHGFLVSEATALPTAPQPRPFPDHTCSGSWSHQKRPRSILQSPQLTAAFAYSKNSCCLFGLNFNKFLWIH